MEEPPAAPKATIFLLRLVVIYILGTGAATLLWVSPALIQEPEALLPNLSFLGIIILVVFMISYKYFILAFILGFIFRLNIWRHMLVWAAAAPFAVAAIYMGEDYFVETAETNFGVYLNSEGSAALLAFFYTIVYALLFYGWNRWRPPKPRKAHAFSSPRPDPSALS